MSRGQRERQPARPAQQPLEGGAMRLHVLEDAPAPRPQADQEEREGLVAATHEAHLVTPTCSRRPSLALFGMILASSPLSSACQCRTAAASMAVVTACCCSFEVGPPTTRPHDARGPDQQHEREREQPAVGDAVEEQHRQAEQRVDE